MQNLGGTNKESYGIFRSGPLARSRCKHLLFTRMEGNAAKRLNIIRAFKRYALFTCGELFLRLPLLASFTTRSGGGGKD